MSIPHSHPPDGAEEQRFETLAELVQAVTGSLELSEALEQVAHAATTLLPDSAARIWVVEDSRLVLRADAGTRGPARSGRATELGFGEGLTGHVALTREVLVVDDLLAEPRALNADWMRREGFVSLASIPLLVRDRLLGVVTFMTRHRHHFKTKELRLLSLFASQAAIAIQNARLFAEQIALLDALRSRQARLEALFEVGRQLSRIQPVESLLATIAQACGRLFDSNSVAFRLVEGDELVLCGIWGHTEEVLSSARLKIGESLTGIVAATGKPLVVRDPIADPRLIPAHHDGYRRLGIRAFLGVPVKTGDQIAGVLTIRTSRACGFSADDMQLATAFAAQAAVAIENARLFSQEQARDAYLSGLLDINKKIGALGPTDALLSFIAEEAARLLGVDNAGFRLRDGDELVVAGLAGTAKETMRRPRLKIGESLSGQALVQGKTLISDVATSTDLIPEHRDADLRLGYVQVLVVPLRVGERNIGVLNIRSRRHFTRRDQEIAEAFADQAAIALENSRLYQELRRAFDELSQTKDQLAQAQKMEAVGLLAGGVAHDFNNLLMVITGRSELLLLRLGPEDAVRQDLELIKSTGQRAADLTRQLLAFSRKQVLQPKVLNLNGIVQGLAPMLERLIGEDIELHAALDPALGSVKADPGQIEQVIMNLAVNARDAMPDGGQLTIETSNVELDAACASHRVGARPGPHVMLAVTDTGYGMDENTRARIFEPFFTTKEVGKGTGLGLSTVHGIVNQSGGTIWVYSEPGRGTTFKIYLPRTTDDVNGLGCGRAVTPPALGSETILLVEDEKGVRDLVRDVLQARGYTVLEAGHGIEALAVARRHNGPIDLLLTDVVMPRMGGPELAECLVALRPGLKILYMSGYTERTVVHHRVLNSDAPYLQKPVTVDAITRRVREALDAPVR
jgi:signal transduction histidine kinase